MAAPELSVRPNLTLEREGQRKLLRFLSPRELEIERGGPSFTRGLVILDLAARGWERIGVRVDDREASRGAVRFVARTVEDRTALPGLDEGDARTSAEPSTTNVAGAALRIQEALRDFPPALAHDVAFHLTDWHEDGAFLVALLSRPDGFSLAEVRAGLQRFLIHVPNHVAAAAKLGGWPIADVFEVEALSGESAGAVRPLV